MDAIVAALKAQGVEDRDIQTRFFNISPRYEYQEVLEEGFRRGKQVLVGYVVNNSASVKIRDLDSVGRVIDEVADAGGDVTRINGISFTVDDTKPFMVTLREAGGRRCAGQGSAVRRSDRRDPRRVAVHHGGHRWRPGDIRLR